MTLPVIRMMRRPGGARPPHARAARRARGQAQLASCTAASFAFSALCAGEEARRGRSGIAAGLASRPVWHRERNTSASAALLCILLCILLQRSAGTRTREVCRLGSQAHDGRHRPVCDKWSRRHRQNHSVLRCSLDCWTTASSTCICSTPTASQVGIARAAAASAVLRAP
jgi:hypothetical protein